MIDCLFLHESTIWNKKPDYQAIDKKQNELMASSNFEQKIFC